MADVAADLKTWSTTASSNAPTDSTTIGAGLADNFQEIQKVVRQDLAHKGADIASAGTTDLGAVAGLMHDITGTTTITSFGTVAAGIWKIVKFEGVLTLTHNATSLILPEARNIITTSGDVGIFMSEGSGNWRCLSYTPTSKPMFFAYASANDNNVTGAGTSRTVTFDSERFDTGSDFNTTTSTFTAPVAGKYRLSASVIVEDLSTAATVYTISIATSNATYVVQTGLNPKTGALLYDGTISVLVDMDAADTAQVLVNVAGMAGDTADIFGAATPSTHFSGHLEGR